MSAHRGGWKALSKIVTSLPASGKSSTRLLVLKSTSELHLSGLFERIGLETRRHCAAKRLCGKTKDPRWIGNQCFGSAWAQSLSPYPFCKPRRRLRRRLLQNGITSVPGTAMAFCPGIVPRNGSNGSGRERVGRFIGTVIQGSTEGAGTAAASAHAGPRHRLAMSGTAGAELLSYKAAKARKPHKPH
jgi:hypothetical protein